MRLWLLVPLMTACIQRIDRGPNLGDCSEPPEGAYTFGEVGIGRCVAGPADLTFFEQDGETWLAVSNVAQYRNFSSGSVLVLDWDALSAELDTIDTNVPPRLSLGELSSVALPILDDDNGDGVGDNAWLGGIGYLPGAERLVVTSRLTEASNIRTGRDELFVIDTSGLAAGDLSLLNDSITLEDDPFPVVVDPTDDRFFVGNLTDHSISVLSSEANPGVIDVADGGFAGDAAFDDVDASDSLASVSLLSVVDRDALRQDAWTLTYLDHAIRLYAPTHEVTRTEEGDFVSVLVDHERWESAGLDTFTRSAFGSEQGLDEILDPVFDFDLTFGARLFGINRTDNSVVEMVPDSTGDWGIASLAKASPAGLLIGSPSVATIRGGSAALYYDLRDARTEPAVIGIDVNPEGVSFTPFSQIVPPDGVSYEDPFVFFDLRTTTWRMWLTVRTLNDVTDPLDDTWQIATSQSETGLDWDPPRVVLGGGEARYGAPVVRRIGQRYGMWFATWNGETWDHAFTSSFDGYRWSDPIVVVEGATEPRVLGEPEDAPRVGVLAASESRWRVASRDLGQLDIDDLTAGRLPVSLPGIDVAVASGQEYDNDQVTNQRGRDGVVPGSVATVNGQTILYATVESVSGRRRIMALDQRANGDWRTLVGPVDMESMLQPEGSSDEVFEPVVYDAGGTYVMFYGRLNGATGEITAARATSADGVSWTRAPGDVFPAPALGDLDDAFRIVHSVTPSADGGVQVWYTGSDGAVERIFSATAADPLDTFVPDDEVVLDVGAPGAFDDVSVKDPLVVREGDQTYLYYAGFDGTLWSIGQATWVDDAFERRVDIDGVQVASLVRQPDTFASFGVSAPVLLAQDEGALSLLIAGHDVLGRADDRLRHERLSGLRPRLGRAVVDLAYPGQVLPAQRFPTSGDTLTFRTEVGGPGEQVIELEQVADNFANPGTGMSSLTLDADRGFLYVTSKLFDQVLVVDVRDDSGAGFDDANAMDVETALAVETRSGAAGFSGSQLIPSRDLLALTMRQPDGLALVDVSQIADDASKEATELATRTFLPLPNLADDAGIDNNARIGGAGMALTADERTLLVTHFNGNGVAAFDLELGAWGEEVAWIRDIGEGPHVIRISPDGRYAVVANYIGEPLEDDGIDGTASGRLTVIHLDPTHERYLEVAAWLVNRP